MNWREHNSIHSIWEAPKTFGGLTQPRGNPDSVGWGEGGGVQESECLKVLGGIFYH